MATIHASIAGVFIVLAVPVSGQQLDKAEVRITYGELKQLLARATPQPAPDPPPPDPALLAARLRLSIEGSQPVIDATFRTLAFGDKPALVPLISGDVALDRHEPENAVIVMRDEKLCLASNAAGTRVLNLRLLPSAAEDGVSISVPPCPSVILETGELPEGRSFAIHHGERVHTLASGQTIPLPHGGREIGIRLLDDRETREALLPPEPSTWTWQNQALVIPADGELIYQIIARATAADGSGVVATLPLPSDARDLTVSGEDLTSHRTVRGDNRSQSVSLVWKTRGTLDRQVAFSYRMPLRPLDTTWLLQAPGGEDTRTRFIIATSPFIAYSADGLSGPLSPQGLPEALAATLNGNTCRHLEADTTAELTATPIPVAPTDDGVVKLAEWTMKLEPDGSMLAGGDLTIEHTGPLDFTMDTPPDMKLLSCHLNGRPVSPVDLGDGRLKVALPADASSSRLACTFTRAAGALDPVEGTLELALPRTPLFIHALKWCIDLPSGYQAETHGNLTRVTAPGSQSARIVLAKNLCRDERPETRVFYQRADIAR